MNTNVTRYIPHMQKLVLNIFCPIPVFEKEQCIFRHRITFEWIAKNKFSSTKQL